jgi:hypothetical protein
MTQPIEVVSILVAAGNRRYPRHHHFEHLVSMRFGSRRSVMVFASRPHTPSMRSFSRSSSVGGLVTAVKINCDFLAADRWKVKGKQRIVGHGGCGA